jgi:hypothetical protein
MSLGKVVVGDFMIPRNEKALFADKEGKGVFSIYFGIIEFLALFEQPPKFVMGGIDPEQMQKLSHGGICVLQRQKVTFVTQKGDIEKEIDLSLWDFQSVSSIYYQTFAAFPLEEKILFVVSGTASGLTSSPLGCTKGNLEFVKSTWGLLNKEHNNSLTLLPFMEYCNVLGVICISETQIITLFSSGKVFLHDERTDRCLGKILEFNFNFQLLYWREKDQSLLIAFSHCVQSFFLGTLLNDKSRRGRKRLLFPQTETVFTTSSFQEFGPCGSYVFTFDDDQKKLFQVSLKSSLSEKKQLQQQPIQMEKDSKGMLSSCLLI